MRHTNILRGVAVCYVHEKLLFSETMLPYFKQKIIPLLTPPSVTLKPRTAIILILIHTVNAQ